MGKKLRLTESELVGLIQRVISEQTTGGGLPVCRQMSAQGCPGTPTANATMSSSPSKCATIGNIPVTSNDVGRDIIVGGTHMTVQSVSPNVNGNGSENFAPAPGPCPRTTGGSTTGGPTPPPPTTCNKTCHQLNPNFKQKIRGKSCNWFQNRLNAFTQKLQTKTPGSCGAKKLTCKISVIQQYVQNFAICSDLPN